MKKGFTDVDIKGAYEAGKKDGAAAAVLEDFATIEREFDITVREGRDWPGRWRLRTRKGGKGAFNDVKFFSTAKEMMDHIKREVDQVPF